MIYLISDTHFNHVDLMVKYCGRPADYEKRILESLKKLKSSDTLIHLGDICIGKDKEIHERYIEPLLCKKILVMGNHDSKSAQWYMDNGWDIACERFDLKIYGKRISFTHVPIAWDGYHDLNIHGHFHNSDHRRHEVELHKIKNGYQKLFAVEYSNYKPISLEYFIK